MKVILSRSIAEVHARAPPDQGLGGGPCVPPHPQTQPSSQRSLVPPNRAPPRRIDHTYRDYSNFPLGKLPIGKNARTKFPSKLHQILSSPMYSHIISWMPHGRAWKIHNKDLLIREVVPKYFVQSKYESFTRQLIGWGFKRLHQSGNDNNSYYHECFLRGLPHLTVLMKRVPPNQGKLLPYVEGEPNFYEIDKQFPLPLPLPPPMMPYDGQYPYSPSHMASAGYGVPLEPPTGYHSMNHYSSYPSNYPPPPPYYAGHPGDPHAAATYTPQSGYPPYSYYPTQYSHQPNEHYAHYPYPPGPLYGVQSHYDNPPTNDTGPVKNEDVPLAPNPQGEVKEQRVHIEDEVKEDSPEPLSIFAESAITTMESSENDVDKEGQQGCCNELYDVEQSMPRLAYPRKISESVGLDETI